MRIIDVREKIVPIKSDISNAYIDFSKMTVSVVAIITDVQRGGKPESGPVTVRLTREHIANMMGMTRQGVHRTLKEFETQGLITLGYGRITIEDEAALREHLVTLN